MTTERHQLPSYPLRIPVELRGRLQKAADEAFRSLNAEILFRVEASFVSAETQRTFAAISAPQNANLFTAEAAIKAFDHVPVKARDETVLAKTIYWRPASVVPLRAGQVVIRRHRQHYAGGISQRVLGGGFAINLLGGPKEFEAWAFLPSTHQPLSFDSED